MGFSDSTLQTAHVFVCAHNYCAVRAVQTALQTATAVFVAASWLVVGMGELNAVVEFIL